MEILFFLICLIFIIYIAFIGLSIYYFIKHREFWNSLFSIESITDCIMEIIACPEHLIIPIPGIILENTKCVDEKKKDVKRKGEILEVLKNVYRNIDIISGDDKIFTSELKCIKWILQGSINDFEIVYNQSPDIFYKLIETHKALNTNVPNEDGKNINENIEKENENNEKENEKIKIDELQIEPHIIENNLEICKTLIESVKPFILDGMEDLRNQYTFALLLKIYNLLEQIKATYTVLNENFT